MAILKLWFTIDNWNSFSLLYVLVMWFIYGAIFHGDGIVFSNNSFCWLGCYTAQKMKSSIKDFVSKCDQIRSFPMENFIVQFYSLLLKYQFLRRSKNVSSSPVLAIILSKQNDKTFFSKVALCFVTKWKLKFHQIWWHQKPSEPFLLQNLGTYVKKHSFCKFFVGVFFLVQKLVDEVT